MSLIETEAGEALRQEAIRALSSRYSTLVERSKSQWDFSPIEGSELEATGRALDHLTAMVAAPTLLPAHRKGWGDATTT